VHPIYFISERYFQNNSGLEAKAAFQDLDRLMAKNIPKTSQSIVSTAPPLAGIPRVKLPNGKRMTYHSEVRNWALLPLLGYITSLGRWGITVLLKIPSSHKPGPGENENTE